MSRLTDNMEDFELLVCTRTQDGQSGSHTAWTVGGTFRGCMVISQTSHEAPKDRTAVRADAQLPAQPYSLLTRRSVSLPYHAVIRRVRDGRVFRILNDPSDAQTPKGAKLDLRMSAAEVYRLPVTPAAANNEGT